MRVLILLLILRLMFTALPASAADVKTGAAPGGDLRPENVEAQKDQRPPDRVERPEQETVKMSPTIRVSPLRPDDDGKMRRTAPARSQSPLVNMPSPKDMSSPQGKETPGGR